MKMANVKSRLSLSLSLSFLRMVRIKLPLRTIHGEKRRNETFSRRTAGIKKKAMELEKLCDVQTMILCYGPLGQLQTWPEDRRVVHRMIDRFLKIGRVYRRYDLSTFFDAHLKQLRADLFEGRRAWMRHISDSDSLADLLNSLDAKLGQIGEKIYRARREEEERERREKEMEIFGGLPELSPLEEYDFLQKEILDHSSGFLMDSFQGFPSENGGYSDFYFDEDEASSSIIPSLPQYTCGEESRFHVTH